MNFAKGQIISLSHPLYDNGQEHFPYAVECKGRMNKDWYIECVCTLGSHCGTHVEVPYHHDQYGQDIKDFPVENLIGECVVLNVEGKQSGEAITAEDLQKYEDQIHENDIVFLHTGYDKVYRQENWQPYPYVSEDALAFLLRYKIRVLGTDASGIEIVDGYSASGRMKELYSEPIHVTCFKNNVAIVESLTNLGEIEGLRTTVFILPVPAENMDAFPCQIIAIKDL